MRSAALVSLLLAGSVVAAPPRPQAFGWHTDYAAARAEAKRSGKPLFVAFRCEP
jgi:hypothetical protein